MIVVPPLYIASDALLQKLVKFVENGGHLVLTIKSGFCNENSTVRWIRAPGPLRKAAGVSYQEFSNLSEPLSLKNDPYKVGEHNKVSDWTDMLLLEGATVLANYDHSFFGKFPAIDKGQQVSLASWDVVIVKERCTRSGYRQTKSIKSR